MYVLTSSAASSAAPSPSKGKPLSNPSSPTATSMDIALGGEDTGLASVPLERVYSHLSTTSYISIDVRVCMNALCEWCCTVVAAIGRLFK